MKGPGEAREAPRGAFVWSAQALYCTNAAQAVREGPSFEVGPLPAALAVGADYGLTVLTGSRAESARRLVSLILSPEGQAILARHGFAAPAGPGG